MIPVKQTILDFQNGNCWASCLASILEIPLESIPVLVPEESDNPDEVDWYRKTYNWLRSQGYSILNLNLPVPTEAQAIFPDGFVILTGPSPRNREKLHCVVASVKSSYSKEGHVYDIFPVHDPHPENTFFADLCPKEITFVFKTIGRCE